MERRRPIAIAPFGLLTHAPYHRAGFGAIFRYPGIPLSLPGVSEGPRESIPHSMGRLKVNNRWSVVPTTVIGVTLTNSHPCLARSFTWSRVVSSPCFFVHTLLAFGPRAPSPPESRHHTSHLVMISSPLSYSLFKLNWHLGQVKRVDRRRPPSLSVEGPDIAQGGLLPGMAQVLLYFHSRYPSNRKPAPHPAPQLEVMPQASLVLRAVGQDCLFEGCSRPLTNQQTTPSWTHLHLLVGSLASVNLMLLPNQGDIPMEF